MAECRKCGKHLDEEWLVCPWCRTSIVRKKSTKTRSHGNGIGTTYKRGSTWTAKVIVDWKTIRDEKGQVVKKLPISRTKGGFKTQAKAAAYCEYLKHQTKDKKAPTLAYYYEAYTDGKGSQLSYDKKVAYNIAYKKMDKIHHVPVDQLTVAALQELLNEKCSTYYPARDMKVLLHHLFKLAEADGYANYKLPELLVLPKLTEREQKAFSKDQQYSLLVEYIMPSSEESKRGAAAALIMIQSGMMPGELLNLTVEMIDFEKNEIHGVGLKTKVRKKTAIVFPQEMGFILTELIGGKTEGKVFPESENKFYKEYYTALDACKIDRSYKPYCCRHTTATELAVDKNMPDAVVKRIMRWSTTKMVDRYAHPNNDIAHDAIENAFKDLK